MFLFPMHLLLAVAAVLCMHSIIAATQVSHSKKKVLKQRKNRKAPKPKLLVDKIPMRVQSLRYGPEKANWLLFHSTKKPPPVPAREKTVNLGLATILPAVIVNIVADYFVWKVREIPVDKSYTKRQAVGLTVGHEYAYIALKDKGIYVLPLQSGISLASFQPRMLPRTFP